MTVAAVASLVLGGVPAVHATEVAPSQVRRDAGAGKYPGA